GIQNTKGVSRGREFLGWSGGDCEAIIDLGKPQSINNVVIHTLSQGGSWVYPPQSTEVFISKDGNEYTSAGSTTEYKPTQGPNGVMTVDFSPSEARFVKLVVKSVGTISEGKAGAGNPAWLFVDEVEVN